LKLALIRQRYTDFGGAELYVSRLAGLLVERGHQVHVIAREWKAEPQEGLFFHAVTAAGPTFVRLKAFARAAARIVAAENFDLVHSFERTYCQDVFRAGDGCHREWLDRRARAAGIGRRRLDRINPRHRAFLELETRLFTSPRLKKVIVNSQQGRDEIIRHYGLSPEMFRVIYNGLDRRRFHPGLRDRFREEVRAELKLEADEPIALFVGSGFARKGLAELIYALPRTKVKLLAAGKDKIEPYLKMARRLGLADRVLFLGPRTDVDRLYGAADLFLLPSWYDPFANACLEAMAAGLPIVTTAETGAAEVVQSGLNGFILSFPVRPDELAEKIELALNLDPSSVITANQRLLTPFDWTENLNQTLQVYQEILGRI